MNFCLFQIQINLCHSECLNEYFSHYVYKKKLKNFLPTLLENSFIPRINAEKKFFPVRLHGKKEFSSKVGRKFFNLFLSTQREKQFTCVYCSVSVVFWKFFLVELKCFPTKPKARLEIFQQDQKKPPENDPDRTTDIGKLFFTLS